MKICILNSTTNVVENICEVEDINNIPSFLIGEGQVLSTDHTGEMNDIWNGSSYDKPVVPDTRTDEEKWFDIRVKRNELLAETDFYALSDVTMTTEMSNYRQALRDLPSSTSNPDDVVFPTKP
tara:strand:+ start:565 stop:933 length:369 start_codon:yes stop_codon:yes gene_type:complete